MNKALKVLIAIVLILVIALLTKHLLRPITPTADLKPDADNSSNVIAREPNLGIYAQSAKLSSVLSTLTLIKTISTEFYLSEGRWPNQLSDLGMTREQVRAEPFIDDMDVRDGAIYADLSSNFGDGATIRLAAKEALGGAQINWVCEMNFELRGFRHCAFTQQVRFPTAASPAKN